MDLFLQRGFDDVTVGEIAEAAGVTSTTSRLPYQRSILRPPLASGRDAWRTYHRL